MLSITPGVIPTDRNAELTRRKERRLRLASHVNRMYNQAVEEDDYSTMSPPGGAIGCFAAIGRRAQRLFGCRTRQSVGITEPAGENGMGNGVTVSSTNGQSSAVSQRSALSTALFGHRKGATASPTTRLQLAQQSITERTITLEQRSSEMRTLAQTQIKEGAKAAALRSLRRSKQLAAQAQKLANASMAVERQADMLEEAGLQQEVAKALQAGVKDIRKVQSAMKTVENISDDAATMADDVDEINSLLAQLADTGADASNIDDEELLAELQEMTGPEDPPNDKKDVKAADLVEAKETNTETSNVSELHEAVLQMPSAPHTAIELSDNTIKDVSTKASKGARGEEKLSLLASQST